MPTILVGVSRGSGLAVAAAGEPAFQPSLAGVVAVALTREEEYVHRLKRNRKAPQEPPEIVMLDNYEYLPRLRNLPLSIIQSTHDDYLPAEEARRLLGPDSRFVSCTPIRAKNHSFTDAREPLYAQMQTSSPGMVFCRMRGDRAMRRSHGRAARLRPAACARPRVQRRRLAGEPLRFRCAARR